LIAANSHPYWQNQQQRQAEKEPVFIEVICEDWYEFIILLCGGSKDTQAKDIKAAKQLVARWISNDD
jgi:exo-beta-1,3-glucanase (GH17 family)